MKKQDKTMKVLKRELFTAEAMDEYYTKLNQKDTTDAIQNFDYMRFLEHIIYLADHEKEGKR